jgi:hypothetical protein
VSSKIRVCTECFGEYTRPHKWNPLASSLRIRKVCFGDQFLTDPCVGTDNTLDTPTQASPNFGKPIFPGIVSSCPDTGANGTMFMNYMDYTDDDFRLMFTTGQVLRMFAVLSNARSSLIDFLPNIGARDHVSELRIREVLAKVYDGVDRIVELEDFV